MSKRPAPFDAACAYSQSLAQALIVAPESTGACQALQAHKAAVLSIAAELQLSPESVVDTYCTELARLAARASVADYLVVLVSKQVRARLQKASTGSA